MINPVTGCTDFRRSLVRILHVVWSQSGKCEESTLPLPHTSFQSCAAIAVKVNVEERAIYTQPFWILL
jgi:hypothetical protein